MYGTGSYNTLPVNHKIRKLHVLPAGHEDTKLHMLSAGHEITERCSTSCNMMLCDIIGLMMNVLTKPL